MTFTEIKTEIEKMPNVDPNSIILKLVPYRNYLAGRYSKLQAFLEFRFEDKTCSMITDRHYIPTNLIKEIENIIADPKKYMGSLKVMEKK